MRLNGKGFLGGIQFIQINCFLLPKSNLDLYNVNKLAQTYQKNKVHNNIKVLLSFAQVCPHIVSSDIKHIT